MENEREMFVKMKSVLQMFREQRETVALLWRPHPLIASTIKSMKPDLWGEYEKIVESYRKDGWGIYDDSADMDRAVILSDAYYGDRSSIVQIYKKTGKPMMIQNVRVSS